MAAGPPRVVLRKRLGARDPRRPSLDLSRRAGRPAAAARRRASSWWRAPTAGRWRAGSGTRARRSRCGSSATGGARRRRRAASIERRRRSAGPARWRASTVAPDRRFPLDPRRGGRRCRACTSTSTARRSSLRYDGGGRAGVLLATCAARLARLTRGRRARGLTVAPIVERRRARARRRPRSRAAVVSARRPTARSRCARTASASASICGRGQKGGLFLDQRENRALVRTLARGRRVLNLFGYTGGFSIYAAAGGAARTTTVDVSAPAIAAARRNFERNDLAAEDAALRRRGRLRVPRARKRPPASATIW